MKVKINSQKLESAINESITELQVSPSMLSSGMCVFDSHGIQIQLLVTRDEDEFYEESCAGYVERETPND